jgi:hypothetical protein
MNIINCPVWKSTYFYFYFDLYLVLSRPWPPSLYNVEVEAAVVSCSLGRGFHPWTVLRRRLLLYLVFSRPRPPSVYIGDVEAAVVSCVLRSCILCSLDPDLHLCTMLRWRLLLYLVLSRPWPLSLSSVEVEAARNFSSSRPPWPQVIQGNRHGFSSVED